MKKTYLTPELNIINFDITDIISHSDGTIGGETPIDPWASLFFDEV